MNRFHSFLILFLAVTFGASIALAFVDLHARAKNPMRHSVEFVTVTPLHVQPRPAPSEDWVGGMGLEDVTDNRPETTRVIPRPRPGVIETTDLSEANERR